MSPLDRLRALLRQRILVLDGAMGTMIQDRGITEADVRGDRFADWPASLAGANDLLVLTQPDVVREIHRAYLEAGADVVTTNTFNAQAVSLADYDLADLAHELNVAAARLARQACDGVQTDDRPRFVAGSIGPMNRTLSLSPDVEDPGARAVTFDEVRAAYATQIAGLVEGGADVLLVETIFDTLNAKACVVALREHRRRTGALPPVMLSGTVVDQSGRTLVGQTVDAFYHSLAHAPELLSVGLNCALGSAQMRPFIEELSGRGPGLHEPLPQRRAPERARRLRRGAGVHGRAGAGLRRGRPPQPRRRLLRDDARAHRRDRRGRRAGSLRASPPPRPARSARPAWRRSRSAPRPTSSTSASGRT